ncbi:hypothetical protein NDK25_23935 [Niallia taxi]|nr:hypothetical protein [Niallia taxi]MDE5055270.1 hypothetical protein [Niallia taxi]
MDIYNFFASPIWQSAGVIVGGIGVYFGAKYGARLGVKSSLELDEKKAKEDSIVKLKAFKREVLYNSETLNQMDKFLQVITPPYNIQCFSAIKIAASHIQKGAWEEFLKISTSNGFSSVDSNINLSFITASIEYERALRSSIRDIEMEIADWERWMELGPNNDLRNKRFTEVKESINKHINFVLKLKDKVDQEDSLT